MPVKHQMNLNVSIFALLLRFFQKRQNLQDFLDCLIAILMGQLEHLRARIIFYFGDKAVTFSRHRSQDGLVGGKKAARDGDKFIAETLHLSDFVDNEQFGVGSLDIQNRNHRFFKVYNVHAVLAHLKTSLNVNVSENPGNAIETFPAETLAIIIFANLPRVKAGDFFAFEARYNVHYRGRFAAARQAG